MSILSSTLDDEIICVTVAKDGAIEITWRLVESKNPESEDEKDCGSCYDTTIVLHHADVPGLCRLLRKAAAEAALKIENPA